MKWGLSPNGVSGADLGAGHIDCRSIKYSEKRLPLYESIFLKNLVAGMEKGFKIVLG
jgi:hypothetical protein